ncbi:MAG: hypothetical protein DME96_13045 [Verrucomicrobia bacterium]|nr:MAG: hypothetical protein DME96_13045 [Verrucomicrobiota bacterium]
MNGKSVPATVLRNTVLITDHNRSTDARHYEIIDATHKRAYWGAAWWSAADRVQVASGKRANSSVLQENRACAFALIFETPPDSR